MMSPSDRPGTSAPCRCFTFLELLVDYPDGPFSEVFASFASAGGYGIRKGYTIIQWNWCPGCGGKLGKYRPELSEAYGRYRAAIFGEGPYAPLLGKTKDPTRFRAQCEKLGARPVSEASEDAMSFELRDAAASLKLSITWDYDHECWYTYVEFDPDGALRADPFLPDPKLESGDD